VKIPLPDPVHSIAAFRSRRGRAVTAVGTAPRTRPRTGTSPTTSIASTARTGRRTGHFQQHRPRTSTADAVMPVLSPAGGLPDSSMAHQPVPEEVEASVASVASAAAFAAASGTEARL
jgi:hypothetical protein